MDLRPPARSLFFRRLGELFIYLPATLGNFEYVLLFLSQALEALRLPVFAESATFSHKQILLFMAGGFSYPVLSILSQEPVK